MIRAASNTIKRSFVQQLSHKCQFHNSIPLKDASFFKMPAMSPTMSEGGIVSWKFKPGESFNSGDVLLEVETDKSNIDVEAVDDGKLVDILQADGSKGVPVGKPIAIIAEPEDDLATLELPKEEAAPVAAAAAESTPEPVKEAPKSTPSKSVESSPSSTKSVFTTANASFKLSPAVDLLLHEHGISTEEAYTKFPASGPKGRLLKGDVLAGLGLIENTSIVKITEFIKSKEHLDLSNIIKAEPKKVEESTKETKSTDVKLEKPKPSNILTVELTSSLGEDISQPKFKYAFEKSIETAIRQTYAKKFPQFASSAIGSSFESEDLFDDLISPSVTKTRFEVYGVNYEFFSNESSISTSTSSTSDFDDLLGLPSTSSLITSSPNGSTTVTVEFKIKFDEKLSDSKQFVKQFEDSLLSQIPANKLIIHNI
ncbi:pyruvate dehydrogenase complex protein X [Scheffersomyces coipomensis]|uniref:pyruvate dehydrogenase complex protein X n=1 Tax=Scheffersomyces coipomensis TaxID=1788519 RepID=UPI00315D6ABD